MLRKKVNSSLMMLFIYAVVSAQNKTVYQPVNKFHPGGDAAKDISNAIHYAKTVHKNILLDFGGDWCIWCHPIDEFISGHQSIKNFLEESYVEVKINSGKEYKNEKLLSIYSEIKGYSNLLVFDSNGKIASLAGYRFTRKR